MFQSFIDWLDEEIKERGLGKVLVSVGALLGIAGAVGTLFGSLPLRAAALVAFVVAALAIAVFLIGDSRKSRSENTKMSALLQQYCDVVGQKSQVRLDISEWTQKVEVSKRGHATVTRRITLVPSEDYLHFLHLDLGQYGSSPPSRRVRHRIKAVAREISVDGEEGARFITTEWWRNESWHQILVHFTEPVAIGHKVTVEVRWDWPLYSGDLMGGNIEAFDVRFSHPVKKATQEVLIQKGRRDEFAASPIGELTVFKPEKTNKTFSVLMSVIDPQMRERYGARIDKTK